MVTAGPGTPQVQRPDRKAVPVSPVRIRPLGGAVGCLVMILVSVVLSVLLTVLVNLGR
jgi:hypothetical protein